MKVIFGSGVVGMLARFLLGDSWTIVPFYRSRFYSFNPPLDDNFIISGPELDPVLIELGQSVTPVWLQRAYSIGGELIRSDNSSALADDWLLKLFGHDYPPHARAYLSTRMGFFVYASVRTTRLYQLLQARYAEELKSAALLGVPTAIGDHYFVRNGVRCEFERAVTTIPLSAMLGLLGQQADKPAYKPLHLIHMETPSLNFEGSTQVMVVDPMFSFFKVTALAKNRYLFHCHQEIDNPGAYFMPILPEFDLIDGTVVRDAIPLGPMPDLGWLERMDIFPVGAYAQHDWCADVGSNFLRLLRYCGRGEKPRVPTLIGRS